MQFNNNGGVYHGMQSSFCHHHTFLLLSYAASSIMAQLFKAFLLDSSLIVLVDQFLNRGSTEIEDLPHTHLPSMHSLRPDGPGLS